MKNETELMLMILKLTKDEAGEYLKWYNSHHYVLGMRELELNVEQRRTNENIA